MRIISRILTMAHIRRSMDIMKRQQRDEDLIALDPWFALVPLGLCEALGEVVIEHMGLRSFRSFRSWSCHRVSKKGPGKH